MNISIRVLALLFLIGGTVTFVFSQDDNVQGRVTVNGYFTQYVEDDKAVFSDGSSQWVVEIDDIPRSQVILMQPVTVTATIEADDGKLKAEIKSIQPLQGEQANDGSPVPGNPLTTVTAIQANPVNNQNVALRGTITQQISNEKYLFTDGTSQIVLDVNDNAPALPLNTPITVHGKVDFDDGKVEIDVVGVVPQSQGAVAPGTSSRGSSTGHDDDD